MKLKEIITQLTDFETLVFADTNLFSDDFKARFLWVPFSDVDPGSIYSELFVIWPYETVLDSFLAVYNEFEINFDTQDAFLNKLKFIFKKIIPKVYLQFVYLLGVFAKQKTDDENNILFDPNEVIDLLRANVVSSQSQFDKNLATNSIVPTEITLPQLGLTDSKDLTLVDESLPAKINVNDIAASGNSTRIENKQYDRDFFMQLTYSIRNNWEDYLYGFLEDFKPLFRLLSFTPEKNLRF